MSHGYRISHTTGLAVAHLLFAAAPTHARCVMRFYLFSNPKSGLACRMLVGAGNPILLAHKPKKGGAGPCVARHGAGYPVLCAGVGAEYSVMMCLLRACPSRAALKAVPAVHGRRARRDQRPAGPLHEQGTATAHSNRPPQQLIATTRSNRP